MNSFCMFISNRANLRLSRCLEHPKTLSCGRQVLSSLMLIVLAVAAFLLAACSDAAPEWTLVNVAGWDSQPGFTLRIPPGWQARQTEGADSYVGEVVGDGVRLVFDYGGDPNLANYPERDYTVVHEDIGGFEATLFTSSAGWTGISFPQLNGPSLTIYGHDLTREQQLLAFAIFRSVRSGYVADGAFIEELGASAPTPQVFHSGGPAVTSFVYEGVEYEPVAGPIRAELLDVERLKSTGLMLTDKELLKGSEGRRVYTLSGVPIEEGFLVGSMQTGFGRPDIWYLRTETAYPVCQPGSSALIYTAVGASPPPPPYGPVTPQPSYTGGPTPTPRPTPATPVVAAPLSSKGLLDAGWPQVNMERLQVGLGGGGVPPYKLSIHQRVQSRHIHPFRRT